MNGARVLLLAAGRGRRAGGPKAWKEFHGRPMLESHLEFFGKLAGLKSLSVAIQKEWREKCEGLSREVTWVEADPDASPLDTLQRLIKASPSAKSFVLHVDMPVFERSIYETLLNGDHEVTVPVYNGRRGHPVLLAPSALADISRLEPKTERLDAWMRRRHVSEMPVSTDVIHRNLNEVFS